MPCNVASRKPYPSGASKAIQEIFAASLNRLNEFDVCRELSSSSGQLFLTKNIMDQTSKLKKAETINGNASLTLKRRVIKGPNAKPRPKASPYKAMLLPRVSFFTVVVIQVCDPKCNI